MARALGERKKSGVVFDPWLSPEGKSALPQRTPVTWLSLLGAWGGATGGRRPGMLHPTVDRMAPTTENDLAPQRWQCHHGDRN